MSRVMVCGQFASITSLGRTLRFLRKPGGRSQPLLSPENGLLPANVSEKESLNGSQRENIETGS